MMWLFLIKSSACLAIFLMFYKLLLEKERMHTFKRFYLLASLLLALVIPSITFVEYVEVSASADPTPITYTPSETITENVIVPITEENPVDHWPVILWTIYGLGVLLFSVKFLRNLWKIVQNIRDNPKLRIETIISVLLQDATVPHTFFNYVFLNRKKFEDHKIPKEVLVHEATHANQKHSLDILFVELLQIIFWFNPLVYLTKNAIKLNHEFLADQAVINGGTATPNYQNILLAFASSANAQDYQSSLANAINYSSIKKRFTVMKTRTSKKAVLVRRLLLLPLLAIMLYSFTETKIVYKKEATTEDQFLKTDNYKQSSSTVNNLNRTVELAGLVLDSETLKPIENVEIYNSNGHILSKTDRRGYYNVQFDELGQGEIQFEFSLHKDGYKTLAQQENWGDLQGKIAFTNYYGLQKKESNAPEFSQHIPNNRNLSYGSVLSNFHLVKTRFEFDKKIDKAKKGNQHVLFEIDNEYYLVNDSGLIKIGSKDNLISINDDRIVRASEVNGILERKEITGMTPLDSNSAHYAIYTIPVDHVVRPLKTQITAENIIIKINKKGQLLFKERLLHTSDLKKALREINKELTFEERKVSVRAILIADSEPPKKILAEIEQILESYGVAQIEVRGPEFLPSPKQIGATQKQLSKYNTLAKKYNAQPKAKRIIPSEDLKSLETIYRKMSEKQKADAQPFPECPDSKSNGQEGATEKQMAEYNTLAKKYNEMLADGGNIRIMKSDIDRLENLHGHMTHEQRVGAEPFPDFPEPPGPPAPPSPTNLSEKERAEEVIEYIIANQDPHDMPTGMNFSKVAISKPQEFIEVYPKVNSYFDAEDINNTIYHNGKKISHLEMMRMQKDGEITSINVFKNAVGQKVISIIGLSEPSKADSFQNPQKNTSTFNYSYKPEESNGIPIGAFNVPRGSVRVTAGGHQLKEGIDYTVNYQAGTMQLLDPSLAASNTPIDIFIANGSTENDVSISTPPAPPSPQEPEPPLNHIIKMAKQGGKFYFKGKEISSDRAIEILKNNNAINVESKRDGKGTPIVKLSTEPIVIDR